METICIKLDKKLLEKIDEYVKKYHYTTRSEFMRAAIREKIKKLNDKENL